jgi:hypothetical protein
MKTAAVILLTVLCAITIAMLAQEPQAQAPTPAPTKSAVPADLPEEYGFYHQTDRGWERMHQNRAAKTEVKRGGFTQWTGIGVGGMHQKLDYAGPHAACQIPRSRPVFYARIVDATHIQEISIIRFKEKKDKRQVETAEMVGERTGGGETRNKAVVYTVIVKRVSPEVFMITPEDDLPAGEYILSQSTYPTEGFDFGIPSS